MKDCFNSSLAKDFGAVMLRPGGIYGTKRDETNSVNDRVGLFVWVPVRTLDSS
jgi:hypothetical protein